MPVAFGSSATAVGDFVSTLTVSAFATAGSDRVGIVHLGGNSEAGAVNGVTWNGVSMTLVVEFVVGGVVGASLWRIIAPPTGASDVVATFTPDFSGAMCASYFTGVDQTTPIRAGSTGTDGVAGGEVMSVACASANGDMGIDAAGGSGGALSSPLGTQIFNLESVGASDRWGAGSYRASVGATVTMGWTGADDCAMVAASLQAAGGTPATRIPFRDSFGRRRTRYSM